jgi:DNA-directed RNA polymerase subunit M/transcription elongation factor TFIIS
MEFYESVQGYIATECPVCGVRLYFRPEQAGTAIRCEMCLQSLEIPQEIKVRPKPRPVQRRVKPYGIDEDYDPLEEREPDPAARDAPQTGTYSLAEPDEPASAAQDAAPSSSGRHQGADAPRSPPDAPRSPPDAPRSPSREETAASTNRAETPTPKRARRNKDLIPVECPKCNNRMYARKDQVGEQMLCADCGTVVVVPQPRAEVVTKLEIPKPVAVSAEEPPQRQHDDRLVRTQMLPEPEPPPEPPKWTFFSGVVSFLGKGEAPRFLLLLSLGYLLLGELAAMGLSAYVTAEGMGGYAAGFGWAMVGGVFVGFVILGIWAMSYAAGIFFGVLQDTANGADEINSWPDTTLTDRMGVFGRWAFLAGLTTTLGILLGQLATATCGGPTPVWAAALSLLLFPYFVLSSLEAQRTLWPFSARVSASLFGVWWGWLIVYLQTGAMFVTCAALFFLPLATAPYLAPLWTAPLLAAATLISARLYGRLLWRTMAHEIGTEARPKDDPWM